jgi:hypothetical protein
MKIDAIVLIHRGGHDYVRDVLKIAATSNPNTRIILLGDEENRVILPNIEHYFISDYENDVRRLEEAYLHLSTNFYDFEFFCLSRWLILNCFCQKQGMNGIFHADSDVLIYSSISDIASALNDFKLAISWGLLHMPRFGPQRRYPTLPTSWFPPIKQKMRHLFAN